MDRLSLFPIRIHRKHQAAIQQFFVYVDRRGGEEHHHRAFHSILLRYELSRRRIFSGGCDGEHAFCRRSPGGGRR
jgi:hypothetical protein